ncbi:uncharacterized protein LOC142342074 [Convolutriloba macropyga]|uniref:uncharacterized protein LOC142342074 n=1 Tax=Convolutriloba macropyga TaxID=536237 RepID=UPI003F51D661
MREELDSDSAATVSPESSAAASESEAESGSPSPVLREQSDGSQPQISGGESDDAESNSEEEVLSSKNCRRHGEQLDFYCHGCKISICKICWKKDHDDLINHPIRLFESILEPQNKIRDRIKKCKEETTKVASKVRNDLGKVVKGICDLEEMQNRVLDSPNNEELTNRERVVKDLVDTQTKLVGSIQSEMNEQFAIIQGQLKNLLSSDEIYKEQNDIAIGQKLSCEEAQQRFEIWTGKQGSRGTSRQLKSARKIFTCEEKVKCMQAVYNSSRQEILCLGYSPSVLQKLSMNNGKNYLTVEPEVKWDDVRRDRWSLPVSIAMTSDNTLYASLFSDQNDSDQNDWRVSVLRQTDFREDREIDTGVIKERRSDIGKYEWYLSARDDKLAIVIRLYNRRDRVDKWECVYIYREETCYQRVTLDITKNGSAGHICYIWSHLIVQTSSSRIAVVSLDENFHLQENKRTKNFTQIDNRQNEQKVILVQQNTIKNFDHGNQAESDQIESSMSSDIKYLTLIDTGDIYELVWVRTDCDLDGVKNGTMGVEGGAEGYLFAGDIKNSGTLRCSLYELDLDRVNNGDRVTSRKEFEVERVIPKCVTSDSTLFAIQDSLFYCNPTVISLDFD